MIFVLDALKSTKATPYKRRRISELIDELRHKPIIRLSDGELLNLYKYLSPTLMVSKTSALEAEMSAYELELRKRMRK